MPSHTQASNKRDTKPPRSVMTQHDLTERELREAFRRSGLWRDGWTYAKAIGTACVLRGLQNTAAAIRSRQQNGNPAPMQRALI